MVVDNVRLRLTFEWQSLLSTQCQQTLWLVTLPMWYNYCNSSYLSTSGLEWQPGIQEPQPPLTLWSPYRYWILMTSSLRSLSTISTLIDCQKTLPLWVKVLYCNCSCLNWHILEALAFYIIPWTWQRTQELTNKQSLHWFIWWQDFESYTESYQERAYESWVSIASNCIALTCLNGEGVTNSNNVSNNS